MKGYPQMSSPKFTRFNYWKKREIFRIALYNNTLLYDKIWDY